MTWWGWVTRRWRVLFRKGEAEAELDDEIRFHLEMEIRDNLRAGMSPEAARRAALRGFGGVERFKEEVRHVRGVRLLDDFLQDTRLAFRSFPKRPGFLLAVVLTLAVGIGGTVAMFAVLDASLMQALPYPEPERLVLGRSLFDGHLGPVVSAHDFEDYRDRSESFEHLGAIAPFPSRLTLTGLGEAERLDRLVVSHDFFRALGVDPILGRHFLREENVRGAERVVMLSYGYWQRRFGGDPAVFGSTMMLESVPHTVVGVMPEGFRFYLDTDVWSPYQLGSDYASNRGAHNFLVVGRLAEGRTLAGASAEADVISAALQDAYPETNQGKSLLLTPLQDSLAERYVSTLTILSLSALLILLVACANVAGLLLARGHARGAELAVRTAMGAGGGRLARQLLTENAWMAVGAGGLGILLGLWAERGVLAFLSLDVLGRLDAGVSGKTLGFAAGVSLATVLLAGLLPAMRAVRAAPVTELRSGGRTAGRSGGTRLRSSMVVTQIALTSVLLTVSGLLLRSFVELQSLDLGFEAGSLLTAEVQVPRRYDEERRIAFFKELQERIAAVPGVRSVAVASHLPVRDPGNTMGIRRVTDSGEEIEATIHQRLVMPGYFADMGIPLISGRTVQESDVIGSELVMVLSESLARRLFGEEDPVGRIVEGSGAVGRLEPMRVVGVVGEVILDHPTEVTSQAMYLPMAQMPRTRVRVGVRVTGDPALVTGPIREILRSMDPDVPLDDVRTMNAVVDRSLRNSKVIAAVLVVFAATALVLAAVGLYGVLAYQVSLRLHEIGIRMALGATAQRVTSRLVGSGLRLVVFGFLLGGVASLAAGRLIRNMLFGVRSYDPVTFGLLGILLVGVGTLACLVPARRAASVDPTRAMRAE